MEQEQFVQLVTDNLKSIYNYALARTSSREDAEDLSSDIVTEILKSQANIKNPDVFYGYIWKIASNTYKKFIRYRVRHPVFLGRDDDMACTYFVTIEDDSDSPEEAFIKSETLSLLRRELALLSEDHRKCTIAYYLEEKPCAQVADELKLSLEMVKYYLFKTRKILKEGIGMQNREFGEKSYNPAVFNFDPIFGEMCNVQYYEMFSRKIAGNIMLSAYYAPVSISDLVMELGIPAPYIEDEVKLLEKYNLITKTSGDKYQTNILIVTKAFEKELMLALKKNLSGYIAEIGSIMKSILPEIKKHDFHGNDFDDNRLMWMMTVISIFSGEAKTPDTHEPSYLFDGCPGYAYGSDFIDYESEYSSYTFAGYSYIDKGSYASFFQLAALNNEGYVSNEFLKDAVHKKRYTGSDTHKEIIEKGFAKEINGYLDPNFAVIFESERDSIKELLIPVAEKIRELVEKASETATEIMKVHAPKNLTADRTRLNNLIYWYMNILRISLVPYLMLQQGELSAPENGERVGIVAYLKD